MPAISKKILHQPYLKYHHFSPWISSIYCSCSNVWKRCILSFSDVLDADKLQDQNRRRNFSQLDSNPTLTIKKYEISLFFPKLDAGWCLNFPVIDLSSFSRSPVAKATKQTKCTLNEKRGRKMHVRTVLVRSSFPCTNTFFCWAFKPFGTIYYFPVEAKHKTQRFFGWPEDMVGGLPPASPEVVKEKKKFFPLYTQKCETNFFPGPFFHSLSFCLASFCRSHTGKDGWITFK